MCTCMASNIPTRRSHYADWCGGGVGQIATGLRTDFVHKGLDAQLQILPGHKRQRKPYEQRVNCESGQLPHYMYEWSEMLCRCALM